MTKVKRQKKLDLNISLFPMGTLEKSFISRQLSVMLEGGLTVPEAMAALTEQTEKKAMKQIIQDVLDRAVEGASLEEALSSHHREFGELFIQIIAAGETGGTLEQNLNFLAEHFRKQYELKKSIQSAMTYPLIVLGMLGALAAAAVLFIFPSFKTLFESLGEMDIPAITTYFLTISDWISHNTYMLGVGILVLIVIYVIFQKVQPLKLIWDRYTIKIPVIGKLFWHSSLSQFAHVFGALLSGGVPVTKALEVTSKSVGNHYFKKIADEAAAKVQQGASLTQTLKPYRTSLTPFFVSMLETGEKSGNLEENLVYIGEYFADELKHEAESLPSVLGPTLLIGVGVAVALFAVSIILPLYKATSAVQLQP